MSLNSLEFLVFVAVGCIGYYLIPKKFQWIWLLIFSYIYYAAGGWYYLGYMLFTTGTIYITARLIDRCSEDQNHKRKYILILGLVLNFGLLGVLKYSNFVIANLNRITNGNISLWSLAIPIGISFYIFQSTGYLLDVYWKRIDSEKNFFRFALFVSFFPQILQGPIGRYSRLGKELFEIHEFNSENIESGICRILWGFFKKLVIADSAAVFVTAFFDDFEKYPGTAIFAVLAYTVQLYGDFSGGMDIVIGIGKLFGINMDENFRQPFFATSITDFWHRWHITLGTWMKDYVFYPVSLSGWMGKFGKWGKKVFGRKTGRTLPICLANLIVFFVVGVWHGAEWKYIIYGMYNGVIIAVSGLLADRYRKWKKALKIDDKSNYWRRIQIIRTFILVNISWFFDRAGSVRGALALMKNAVTHFDISQIVKVTSGNGETTKYTVYLLGILCFGVSVLFAYSFFKEKGLDLMFKLKSMKLGWRLLAYGVLFIAISAFGQLPALTGGFIYEQF